MRISLWDSLYNIQPYNYSLLPNKTLSEKLLLFYYTRTRTMEANVALVVAVLLKMLAMEILLRMHFVRSEAVLPQSIQKPQIPPLDPKGKRFTFSCSFLKLMALLA